MSLLHGLAAYARGNLTGIQGSQRDFSPFVAHFTTWSAMADLRAAVKTQRPPRDVRALFETADEKSWATVQLILGSRRVLARSPSEKDRLPPCVCLSECTLPALVSHAERYGRFGLVFSKRAVFEAGGRPCVYVGREEYAFLAAHGRDQPAGTPEGRLFALANVYDPPHRGPTSRSRLIQDYTHEREWRVFGDLDLATTKVEAILAPQRYAAPLLALGAGAPVVPIDTLFEWGA
jgi:hypothetical protein